VTGYHILALWTLSLQPDRQPLWNIYDTGAVDKFRLYKRLKYRPAGPEAGPAFLFDSGIYSITGQLAD